MRGWLQWRSTMIRSRLVSPALLSALLFALIPAMSLRAQSAETPRVNTDKGELAGKLSDDGQVRAFLGVPYAAPPVGPLRWKPPQPAAAWHGLRAAQSYGFRCMQAN